MKKILKLQRSESFYIRDGWMEKVFSSYKEGSKGTFSTKEGTRILGIGSNMVKSLRYWVDACQLVEAFSKDSFILSEKGKLLFDNDPYMETIFSWGLLHYWLSSNKDLAPVFYSVFNNRLINQIKRKDTSELLALFYEEEGFENPNIQAIQKDVSTLLSSYVADENDEDRIPEQNISCPLSKLRLIKKISSDGYQKVNIPYSCVDYRMLYICLRERYTENIFNIDEAMNEEGSPVLCMNMDRVTFLGLLAEMKKAGLIELNRTAGLNVAYLKSVKTDDELFKSYLSEDCGRIQL